MDLDLHSRTKFAIWQTDTQMCNPEKITKSGFRDAKSYR